MSSDQLTGGGATGLSDSPRIFVLIPGAWMGGWVWEPVAERLRDVGYQAHTPTLTGLDAKDDCAAPGLADHVREVVGLLDEQDLTDVVLVGHSYSGLIAGSGCRPAA
jgi:pimeloyl-ACP methyl ester carboxylesterase